MVFLYGTRLKALTARYSYRCSKGRCHRQAPIPIIILMPFNTLLIFSRGQTGAVSYRINGGTAFGQGECRTAALKEFIRELVDSASIVKHQ
jgi:hypothetical protein